MLAWILIIGRAKDINKSFLQLEAKADAYMEEMKTEEKELEEQ